MPELDFVENAAIWTFAGLLAISASPLAAIAFLTVAPKFVIAMRTGDLGAIVTIYVDGIPAAVVDTYTDAPGVIRKIIVGDPDLETHQVYVQKDDNPDTTIQVIRKELSADEVTPPNQRYNEDCDCIQTTYDDGVTWTDTPGADPRSAPQFRAPALATADPRCDAAANMVAALRDMVAADVAFDAVSGLVTDLTGILFLFFPEVGLIVGAILLVAQTILDIGGVAITAAFTETVYDDLLCVFYDHIDADGQMSDAQLADIYSDVAANFDVIVQAIFGAHSSTIGAVGWSNAGALGTETGDCSACDQWCHVIDFTLSDGGFSSDTTNGTGANYVPGVGWTENAISGNSGTYIIRGGLAAVEWTSIEFVYDASGAVTSGVEFGVLATVFQFVQADPANDGTDLTSFWNGSATMDTVGLQLGNQSGGGPTGTSTIKRVTMRGPGADNNPFGSNNC
jgi:hypothetical protein